MSQYILILAWIGLVAIFTKYVKVNKTVLVEGEEVTRYYWLFAFIAFLPIILMAGFRSNLFGDTGSYARTFSEVPNSLSEINDFLSKRSRDKGFYVFEVLIKTIIPDDSRIFFTIIASIQGIILLSVYRYYSINYVLSIFLFVVSADYLSWMFNGMRQFLAVTIILAATPLILKKKYVPLILIILFASFFHQSALLMIPVVFIVQGKAWNFKTLTFVAFILIAVLFVDRFTNFLNDSLSTTQYSNVVSDYTSAGDNGTNPIRALVYSIPTIASLFLRKEIEESNSRLINICVNMSIVSTGLYILSVFTSGVFIGRLPIFCSLFNYILLPWEIEKLFDSKNRPIIYGVVIVFYLLFYLYQVHIIWRLF